MATDFTAMEAAIDSYIDAKEIELVEAASLPLYTALAAYMASLTDLGYTESNARAALVTLLQTAHDDIVTNAAVPDNVALALLVSSAERAAFRALVVGTLDASIGTVIAVNVDVA